jgi:hypothetical protein
VLTSRPFWDRLSGSSKTSRRFFAGFEMSTEEGYRSLGFANAGPQGD